MQCEAIIPEATEPIGSEMVEAAPAVYEERDGETEPVLIEPARYEHVVHYRTIPEHRCEGEATMLARSLKQETCSHDGLHWVKDGPDRGYCPIHFRPGTVTEASGRVSAHPAMSIDEYQDS
jgi:hypothetical protein